MSKKTDSFQIRDLQTLFKALGDENRLNIVEHLCCCPGSPANVGEISTCCDVDLSVVSRHLATLKNAGILKSEKKGKEVFYVVNAKELAKTLRSLADSLEKRSKK